jgi:hypothetical protein
VESPAPGGETGREGELILTICKERINDQFSISMLGIRWVIARKSLSDKELTIIRRRLATASAGKCKAVIQLRKLSKYGGTSEQAWRSILAAPAAAREQIAAAAVARIFASP